MLLVSLTGGIASGKSVVAEVFKNLGCYIHSADKVAHQLMEPEMPAWKSIVNHFGPEILNPDETINRQKLGLIIFSNPKERAFINQLIHPLVMDEKRKIVEKLRKEGKFKIFVSEAALTIEAGFMEFFDRIVLTYCKKKIQISRLIQRDNISRKEAIKKIQAQLSPVIKKKYAHYIIDTSGQLQSTIEQAERVFRSLMRDYELKYGSQT